MLGPAWHRGDERRPGGRPLVMLCCQLLLDDGRNLAGCGEHAAGGVDGGGEVIQGCGNACRCLGRCVVGGQEGVGMLSRRERVGVGDVVFVRQQAYRHVHPVLGSGRDDRLLVCCRDPADRVGCMVGFPPDRGGISYKG